MFGGLHIEMAALITIGEWLEDSGWTAAIVQAKIASAGTADSYIKAMHVSRTRHAHQVTASALYILMTNAYQDYSKQSDSPLDFDSWKEQIRNESPQFLLWYQTLERFVILVYDKGKYMHEC